MSHPVFISYARRTSRNNAEALHFELGRRAVAAFLDTSDIEAGVTFPSVIADAVLGARVFVAFADEAYFRRWYCLRELHFALSAYLACVTRGGTAEEKRQALQHIVVVLPPQGHAALDMNLLPPELRVTNWLHADETERLAGFIEARLEKSRKTIEETLGARNAAAARDELVRPSRLPAPGPIGGIPHYPVELIPSIGEALVGREDDLWRIHHLLYVIRGEKATTAGLTGALEAAGGFGKTRLAVEYLWRFGPLYYGGGLFWVDADETPEGLEQRFHGIIKVLKPDTLDLKSFRESKLVAATELAKVLQARSAEQFLFVVDNVPEPEADQTVEPLSAWCPGLGTVTTLVTSRRKVHVGEPGVVELEIRELSPEPAVGLLTRDVPNRVHLREDQWHLISEWVGRLPLALELLSAALRSGLTPGELLRKAETGAVTPELDRFRDVLRGQVPEGKLRGITEALLISYNRLPPDAQAGAQLVSFCAPDPIPVELLNALKVPFSVRATLIGRHFLLTVAGGAVEVAGSMHRVIADFLRHISGEPAPFLEKLCDAFTQLMPEDRYQDPENWPQLAALLPHLETLGNRLVDLQGGTAPEGAVRMLLALGGFHSHRGFLESARKWDKFALAIAKNRLGDYHPATLVAQNDLSTVFHSLSRFQEARELQEKALKIQDSTLGSEHPDTLASLSNLGTSFRGLGKLKKAGTLLRRALRISTRTHGPSHPKTLVNMANLGWVLYEDGKLRGARQLLEKCVRLHEETLGNQHPATLSSKHSLAAVARAEGNFPKARALYEEIRQIRENRLGPDHPDTLTAIANLAVILRDQGDLSGARQLQEQILEVQRRVLGSRHASTLHSANNLAMTYRDEGRHADARRLLEELVKLREETEGQDHPDTLISLNNLALVLRDEKQIPEARRLQEKILSLRLRVRGRAHPETTKAAWNLYQTLSLVGDRPAAERLLKDHLVGLLERNEDELDQEQREIRGLLLKVLMRW